MSNDRSAAELESDFAAIASVAARRGSQTDTLTILLHIGDEQVIVLSGHGDRAASVRQLALGAVRIARDYFHHDPPTSHEIERAIDFVEEEIVRLGKPADQNATLWCMVPSLRTWNTVSGSTLTIEIVEQWFQRLAAASLGQSGAIQGLPAGREAAATLLVLREFMHHQSYASITVVEPSNAATG